MTHLRIEQNNGVIEEVNVSIITKLYEIAFAGLDMSSNLKGRLHTPVSYRSYVEYLTGTYPELYINSDDYAIPFEDQNMVTYLNSIGVGSNGAITESQASAASIVANSANTTVTKFNELRYFTSITSSKGGWDGSSSGNCRFQGWTALEEVDISNFTSIGHWHGYGFEDTFNGCTSLKTVTASDKLIKIGTSAFRNCSNLETISGLSGVIELGGGSFHTCSKLTSNSFSNVQFKVTQGDSQFYSASSLTAIPLASGSTIIPTSFAQNATSLQSITIPEGVITIGNNAFYGCTSLTQITLPSSCTTINRSAFQQCSNAVIEDVVLPNLISLGSNVFRDTKVKKVSNLGSITSVEDNCFYNCTNLTEVVLPATVTTMGDGVFSRCTGLQHVVFESTTPPQSNGAPFSGQTGCIILVPSSAVSAYQTAWPDLANRIQANTN